MLLQIRSPQIHKNKPRFKYKPEYNALTGFLKINE